jgi:hypothetical protein
VLLAVVSGCSETTLLDVTDEELGPAVVTWVNQTGLVEDDADVWRQRLTDACDQGVWDDGVAERLADRYVTEDLDVAMEGVSDGEELRARAAEALWIMAVQVCDDDFPEGEIEEGPPGA